MKNPKGFYLTPNKDIPLNDRPKGEIAQVAKDQLKRFEQAADGWPLVEHKHHTDEMPPQLGMCCRFCDQTLYFTRDTEDRPYQYERAELRAVVVGHIRRCHENLVDERGMIIDEDAGKHQVLDSPSMPHTYGFGNGNAYRPQYQGGDSRGIEYT